MLGYRRTAARMNGRGLHMQMIQNSQQCHNDHHNCLEIRYLYTCLDRLLGFQEVEASRISRYSVHEGFKVVSPTHQPPLLAEYIPGIHFCYSLSRRQGNNVAGGIMLIKTPMTPWYLRPSTL
jgi:hypothetical protein